MYLSACVILLGLLWFWLFPSVFIDRDGELGGRTVMLSLLLLGSSYLLAWSPYIILSRQPLRHKLARCGLVTVSFSIAFLTTELLGQLSLVDYSRMPRWGNQTILIGRQPWYNSTLRVDPELVYRRRPNTHLQGVTRGGLAEWLNIPTDRRYVYDVQYDASGFRNESHLLQASVAVLGDSFVELPIVRDHELLSSVLSRQLRTDVANLGQMGYGPQQELVVLQRYALNLRPHVVLWLFFEGNDLSDIARYDSRIRTLETDLVKFRSFYMNSLRGLRSLGLRDPANAPMESLRKISIALPFVDGPTFEDRTMYFGLGREMKDLSSLARAEQMLLRARELSEASGATYVLVYVPTKFRVYREYCLNEPQAECAQWVLTDLPSRLSNWAEQEGIRFIDLSPALEQAALDGQLVFFLDDEHWNGLGNAVAAEVIESYLRTHGLVER